jgi:hydroxyacylglutathione hydrolase
LKEHLSYFLYDGDKETPWGVLSGDAFFELKEANDVTPVDVRKPEEWEAGHITGATHAFLGKLREQINDFDPSRAYATYCASGFRASIASSLLEANGINDVRNVPGSWKAWTAAGYQTTTSDEE